MAVPSYRLLVVDDSKRDTLLLERILQQASDATFTVTHMESAKAGLEELSAQPYDLVLLDYYLPDMDGLAFLEEKQKRGLTAPVIMLTAFGQERLPVAALQAGGARLLPQGSGELQSARQGDSTGHRKSPSPGECRSRCGASARAGRDGRPTATTAQSAAAVLENPLPSPSGRGGG